MVGLQTGNKMEKHRICSFHIHRDKRVRLNKTIIAEYICSCQCSGDGNEEA